MKEGIKHLIECHCVLPQFRDRRDPVYHRFVVFSEIDDNDNVIVKYAQCNNCGVVHRVTDIAKSEIILGKDESVSIVSIDDIKLSLPSNVVSVLESYAVDLPTWEEVAYVLENQRWGSIVILSSEEKLGKIEGKCLRFLGPLSVKIEPYSTVTDFPMK